MEMGVWTLGVLLIPHEHNIIIGKQYWSANSQIFTCIPKGQRCQTAQITQEQNEFSNYHLRDMDIRYPQQTKVQRIIFTKPLGMALPILLRCAIERRKAPQASSSAVQL